MMRVMISVLILFIGLNLSGCEKEVIIEKDDNSIVEETKAEEPTETLNQQKWDESNRIFQESVFRNEPLKYVDYEEEGIITSRLESTISFGEEHNLNIDKIEMFVYTTDVMHGKVNSEVQHYWNQPHFETGSKPYVFNIVLDELEIGMYYSQHVNVYLTTEDGDNFNHSYDTLVVRSENASPIPESVKKGDRIKLPKSEFKYTVYESAHQWVDENPTYMKAIINSGIYDVTHEYTYCGRKYINLDGVGWIIVPRKEQRILHNVRVEEYEDSIRFDQGKVEFTVKRGDSNIYDYKDIKVKMIKSKELDAFSKHTEVSDGYIYPYSDSSSDNDHEPVWYYYNVDIEEQKGYYITIEVYASYFYEQEEYKDILVDEHTFYYE